MFFEKNLAAKPVFLLLDLESWWLLMSIWDLMLPIFLSRVDNLSVIFLYS